MNMPVANSARSACPKPPSNVKNAMAAQISSEMMSAHRPHRDFLPLERVARLGPFEHEVGRSRNERHEVDVEELRHHVEHTGHAVALAEVALAKDEEHEGSPDPGSQVSVRQVPAVHRLPHTSI
jgi:hypothetical protein